MRNLITSISVVPVVPLNETRHAPIGPRRQGNAATVHDWMVIDVFNITSEDTMGDGRGLCTCVKPRPVKNLFGYCINPLPHQWLPFPPAIPMNTNLPSACVTSRTATLTSTLTLAIPMPLSPPPPHKRKRALHQSICNSRSPAQPSNTSYPVLPACGPVSATSCQPRRHPRLADPLHIPLTLAYSQN
jgi:hypothetical protein